MRAADTSSIQEAPSKQQAAAIKGAADQTKRHPHRAAVNTPHSQPTGQLSTRPTANQHIIIPDPEVSLLRRRQPRPPRDVTPQELFMQANSSRTLDCQSQRLNRSTLCANRAATHSGSRAAHCSHTRPGQGAAGGPVPNTPNSS
jgi:hypothetical protein